MALDLNSDVLKEKIFTNLIPILIRAELYVISSVFLLCQNLFFPLTISPPTGHSEPALPWATDLQQEQVSDLLACSFYLTL